MNEAHEVRARTQPGFVFVRMPVHTGKQARTHRCAGRNVQPSRILFEAMTEPASAGRGEVLMIER
jgi:hypothetical protein